MGRRAVHPRRRNQAGSSVDGESLQADVMRFMAIIGFCLVAIMGLVRDVNPPPINAETGVASQPVVKPEAIPAAPKRAAPKAAAPEAVAAKTLPEELPHSPPLPSPVPVPVPAPTPVAIAVAAPVSNPAPEELATTQAAEVPPDEPGLSLRFNSDRDFLRLVSGGDVALYLFDDLRAFRLEQNYALREAKPPGQLYELLPATIPAGIRHAAEGGVTDAAQFKWGVAMPSRIAQQITTLVQTETSGQLVIDRFGAVRHERLATNVQNKIGGRG